MKQVTFDLPIDHTSSSPSLDVLPSLVPPSLWEPEVDAHDNYILTALISAARRVLNDPFPTASDDREALLYDPRAPFHSSTVNIYMQHAENILAALSPGYAELSAGEMIAFVSDVNFTAPECGYCGEEDLTVGEMLVSLERGMEEVGTGWLEVLLIAAGVQGLGTGLRLEEVVRRAAEVYRRSDVARELQPFSRKSDEGKCKDFASMERGGGD